MVVTCLSEWCVTSTIPVLCGPVHSSYRELGKDLFLHWTDTDKEENSSKREREEMLPQLSSSSREGDWQCLASFEFPTSD